MTYQDLLTCYLSGQISEPEWTEILRDEVFKKWLEQRKDK